MQASQLEQLWPGKSKWFFLVFLIILAWFLKIALEPNDISELLADETTTGKVTNLAEIKRITNNQPLAWMVNGTATSASPLTIMEYVDFTCVHCLASRPAVNSIIINHPEIILTLHDRTPNERSLNLALAAHCAGEQGKYWQAYNKFFDKQSDTFGQDVTEIIKLAPSLGVDETVFTECLKTQKYLTNIKTDMQQQETLGVVGTPTWYVNDEKLEGEMTVTESETIIKKIKGL